MVKSFKFHNNKPEDIAGTPRPGSRKRSDGLALAEAEIAQFHACPGFCLSPGIVVPNCKIRGCKLPAPWQVAAWMPSQVQVLKAEEWLPKPADESTAQPHRHAGCIHPSVGHTRPSLGSF